MTAERIRQSFDNVMTMAEQAEAWWAEQGNLIPAYLSQEWWDMYGEWCERENHDHRNS